MDIKVQAETQDTITRWGVATFGPCSALEIAARTNLEMHELLERLAHAVPDDYLDTLLGEQKRLAREINARVNALSRSGALSDVHRRTDTKGAADECADVAIMLMQVSSALGEYLYEHVVQKMRVNRQRTWAAAEDGTIGHVKQQGEG